MIDTTWGVLPMNRIIFQGLLVIALGLASGCRMSPPTARNSGSPPNFVLGADVSALGAPGR
ncbi:MAG TPA: hypothetical protein VFD66_03195, partial [Verrucomicrobiae bacterium]|nr:hypothetical protein [Verrucomicrobiae bacterium]